MAAAAVSTTKELKKQQLLRRAPFARARLLFRFDLGQPFILLRCGVLFMGRAAQRSAGSLAACMLLRPAASSGGGGASAKVSRGFKGDTESLHRSVSTLREL
jgi:hypothetical protein